MNAPNAVVSPSCALLPKRSSWLLSPRRQTSAPGVALSRTRPDADRLPHRYFN
ncbi:hypothetical protein HN51_046833, partial [Arachis hypogaea]